MYSRTRLREFERAVAAATGPAARAEALVALATTLARTGEAERALVLAEEARTLAVSLSDPRLVAAALHAIARCHFYLADCMHALELLLQAARAYQEQGALVEVRVSELKVERKVFLIYPAKRALSHAARAFLDLVRGPKQEPVQ